MLMMNCGYGRSMTGMGRSVAHGKTITVVDVNSTVNSAVLKIDDVSANVMSYVLALYLLLALGCVAMDGEMGYCWI